MHADPGLLDSAQPGSDMPATAGRRGVARGAGVLLAGLTSVWFAPLVATVAVCSWRATGFGLWWDELASTDMASRSAGQILRTIGRVDAVHGAYYLLLHFWTNAFGDSLASLRMPGVLAMGGAAVCTSLTAARVFGKREALAAGLTFALVPSVVRYATEVRSFALVTCAAAAATLFLLRALERGSWRRWMLYAFAVAVVGLLNLVALTLLAGHVAAAVFLAPEHGGYRALRRFAAAVAVALCVDSPLMWLGMRQSSRQIGGVPKPTLNDLAIVWPEAFSSKIMGGVALAALLLLWLRRERRAVAFVTAIAVLPFCLLWLASLGPVSYFYFARYLVFEVPVWALAVGAAVGLVRSARLAAIVLLGVAAAVLPDQRAMHATYAHFKFNYPGGSVPAEGYKPAAAFVAHGYQPGDEATFAEQINIREGLAYYLPRKIGLEDVFVTTTAIQRDDLFPLYCADANRCAKAAGPRVWLVVPGQSADPFTALPPDQAEALRAYYRLSSMHHVTGMTVALLVRNG